MKRKRLVWQLFIPFLAITVVSLLAAGWYASGELRSFHFDETMSNLTSRARIFENLITEEMPKAEIDRLCKKAGQTSETRITVVAPDGVVMGDTDSTPATMDNHGTRPEIQTAFDGKVGWKIRRSDTLSRNMMYVAVPVMRNQRIICAVRTSTPMTSLENALKKLYQKIAIGVIIIGILAACISLAVSRNVSRPIEEMKKGIGWFAEGDLTRRLPIPDSDELSALAMAMNDMALQLHNRIQTVIRQRNELNAVFSSMTEGVIALDMDERVQHMNSAAESILDIDSNAASGKLVQEIVRNSDLQNFISATIKSGESSEANIVWHGAQDRHFQVQGTLMADPEGKRTGVLIVLNEVTKLYKLERVRRDFVANVSHELRTPITSIRGFAETLMESEMAAESEEAKRFLAIISRQASRLNLIVEDLLSLSRAERQAEKEEANLSEGNVREVIEAAMQSCEISARDAEIDLEVDCPEKIMAMINPDMLERAIVNLIDNAIKYSGEESTVSISARAIGGAIKITIKDEGCGIPEEHLARIFERFYRVDKARSRQLGGTGLGLAIVKHIALLHKGNVGVESTFGMGSEFSIILPEPNNSAKNA